MKYEETVREVNGILTQYTMALTLRQVYYRLVAAVLIPNTRSAYNSLSSQLVTAREQGQVDEARFIDRSRRIDDNCFDTPESFLQACRYTLKVNYVRRFWTSQPTYVEVWVEKDALSQVLLGAVKDLNTIVAPSRGYSSYSYLRDASHRIDNQGKDRAVVLHFADHDPSGIDMSRDLEERLSRYSSTQIEVKRIALTFDQVKEYSLIPNPTKLADPRSGDYVANFGDECWELDAIEPDELVRIAEEAVSSEVEDWDAWEELKELERKERAELEERLKRI